MNPTVQRYVFEAGTDPDDIRAALLLALWGTESLHGETNVRLEAGCFFDPEQFVCTIEENVPVGRDLNRLFLGYLIRELGADSFTTERTESADIGASPSSNDKQTEPVGTATEFA